MEHMLFSGWEGLLRTLVVGVLAYVSLVVFLRISGKRTLYRGEFLPATLRRARVAEDEVRAAVRSAGLASLNEAEAVVLETDGSFSVVRRGDGNGRPSLAGVQDPRPNSESAEPITR